MHIERVVVGVVFGIAPCDRLGSKAIPIVHVEFGASTVALPRIPIGLAHYFPSLHVPPQSVDVKVLCGLPTENKAVLTLGKVRRGKDSDQLASGIDLRHFSYVGVSLSCHINPSK